jgi:hypothetical protein
MYKTISPKKPACIKVIGIDPDDRHELNLATDGADNLEVLTFGSHTKSCRFIFAFPTKEDSETDTTVRLR